MDNLHLISMTCKEVGKLAPVTSMLNVANIFCKWTCLTFRSDPDDCDRPERMPPARSCRHFSPEICDTTDQGWEEKAALGWAGDWIQRINASNDPDPVGISMWSFLSRYDNGYGSKLLILQIDGFPTKHDHFCGSFGTLILSHSHMLGYGANNAGTHLGHR